MRKLWVLAVVFLGAVFAYAGPQTFTFVGFSGGNWEAGYPYYVADASNSELLDVMCDDYVHGGNISESWQANVTNLGSFNVSMTRFGHQEGAVGLGMYRQAGWILLQTENQPQSMWLDMNEAVWHIFDPQAPIDQNGLQWITMAQQAGRNGFAGVNFNDVSIITPVDQYNQDPNSIQEFLYINNTSSGAPGSTTPEPGTFVLLGTGLLAVLGRKFVS
jgi:PEP-CTERM motif